jgi:alanine racemase
VHDDQPTPRTTASREAQVSLDALQANFTALSARASDLGVIADVRADGYGHGAVEVARATVASGADWLGVSSIADGIALRNAGLTVSILAMRVGKNDDLGEAVRHGVTPAVADVATLERVIDARVPELHLDVTVGGGGITPEVRDVSELVAAAVVAHDAERIRIGGLMGSPRAGAGPDPFDLARQALVGAGVEPAVVHRSTSASLVVGAAAEGTHVRLGRGLYGVSPVAGRDAADFGLVPAMTLTSRVLASKRVGAGEGVSYGYVYRTSRPSTLALCALGYADGIDRHACEGSVAWHDGAFYPIAGRVAMDVFMLDVGGDSISEGDTVILFGDPAKGAQSPDAWARSLGKQGAEVVSTLGPRVMRSYR